MEIENWKNGSEKKIVNLTAKNIVKQKRLRIRKQKMFQPCKLET